MKKIKNYNITYLFLLILILLTPFMVLRDVTPANELRYLSIVDEALKDGHLFAFYNQGMIYADKPPLYFWLMMLCRLLFGQHCVFALSLLSLIPMFGILLVMDRWMRDELGSSWTATRSAAAALMLASCGLFMGLSVFLRMDMLMCFFIVLSLHVFYRMYTGKGNCRRQAWVLSLYVFLALLSKGPVGLLVPPLTILAFLAMERRLKTVGKYLGWRFWLVLLVLSGLWLTGVWLDGGKEYLDNLLFHQTMDRAVNAFHHKEPFWYYLVCIWYLMMPYALLLIPVFIASLVDRSDKGPAERLFLVTVTLTLVMLSCFSSKLGIYLTPIFPFMVYLLPLYLSRKPWKTWMSILLAVPAVVLFLVATLGSCLDYLTGFVPLAALLEQYPFLTSLPVALGYGALLIGMVVVLEKVFVGKHEAAVQAMALSLFLTVFFCSFKMKEINPWIGYRDICRQVDAADPEGKTLVRILYVNRPENMDVYLGRDIVNYGTDQDRFLESAGEEGGLLIVKQERIGDSGKLRDVLEGKRLALVGPYALYDLDGIPVEKKMIEE